MFGSKTLQSLDRSVHPAGSRARVYQPCAGRLLLYPRYDPPPVISPSPLRHAVGHVPYEWQLSRRRFAGEEGIGSARKLCSHLTAVFTQRAAVQAYTSFVLAAFCYIRVMIKRVAGRVADAAWRCTLGSVNGLLRALIVLTRPPSHTSPARRRIFSPRM